MEGLTSLATQGRSDCQTEQPVPRPEAERDRSCCELSATPHGVGLTGGPGRGSFTKMVGAGSVRCAALGWRPSWRGVGSRRRWAASTWPAQSNGEGRCGDGDTNLSRTSMAAQTGRLIANTQRQSSVVNRQSPQRRDQEPVRTASARCRRTALDGCGAESVETNRGLNFVPGSMPPSWASPDVVAVLRDCLGRALECQPGRRRSPMELREQWRLR